MRRCNCFQASLLALFAAALCSSTALADEVLEAKAILQDEVRRATQDLTRPWAVAHGTLAFGKDYALADGQRALKAVVERYASLSASGRLSFPTTDAETGRPISPHPGMFLKIALDVGDELADARGAGDGRSLTLEVLARDLLPELDLRKSYHNQEWILEVLFQRGPDKDHAKAVAEVALKLLEREQSYIEAMLGDRAANLEKFQKKARPIAGGRMAPDAIHAYFCGGLHLVQAVVTAAAAGLYDDAQKARVQRQLEVVLFRAQAEGRYWDRVADQVLPKLKDEASRRSQSELFSIQKLKVIGHALEALHKARRIKLFSIEGERKTWLADASLRLAKTVKSLLEGGSYGRVGEMLVYPKTRQLGLDLVGDSAHALRGLTLAD